MKNRMILITILAATIISGVITGCGSSKDTTAKAASTTKTEKSSDPDKAQTEKKINGFEINVTVDNGWDSDSTPAILHVTSDTVDFCHAITPDAEGGKGSTTVSLANDTYTVEFISPLNHDGSAYEIFDMGTAQEITVEYGKDMVIDCEMTQIPADKVTDEMIQDIVKKTQDAIAKGDDTLKGDAGKDTLDKLAENVQNSPNASEETKDMAESVKTETEVKAPEAENQTENKTENNAAENNNVQNNNSQNNNVQDNSNVNNNTVQNNNNAQNNNAANNNVQNNNNTQAPAAPTPVEKPVEKPSAPVVSTPETPVHTHSWADHTVTTQEWIANIVTIPDYETQTTYVWVCACGAEMASGTEDAHCIAHLEAGEDSNGHCEARTTQVQVGSHTEDQGHYENKTTVDYRYCTGCGAKQ
ncbi:hypothetical protein FMM80_27610 [Schaedlerella arabinosiphila]|uniref:Uncharacterized protein n=1 Tax=Schaedlerella arabinosiphila TaxID=2044587 RepID=A0A9X5CCK0_9FIRM|nr:hypothetical protein [Schaedlerella arabinosiphila]KAI4440146.1 hypothetical protein C824_002635 [Schaedlerella arabinosiphila]NDO72195.1 hypothetical protein [Schaedlerella arabinosiphila]